MEIIIFERPDQTVGVLFPTAEGVALGMIVLGEKDIPEGFPFWVVDSSVLPSDNKYRAAWRLDGTEGVPDGYGEQQ